MAATGWTNTDQYTDDEKKKIKEFKSNVSKLVKFEKGDYKKDEKPDEKETQKLEELADKFGEKTFNAYDRKVYEKFGGAVFYQYYFYSDHTLCTGFHKINGYYFYFDEETGKKATGWKTIDGKRYYFGLTGAAAVEEDGDKKYTFSNEGVLADGIVKIDAEWKFKKEDGSWAKSEFVTSKGNIYYIGEDEAALTGWHTIEDKLYHFDNDGKLSKGLFSDDSGLYYIDKNGAQKDKWVTAGDKTYYFDGDGKAVSGWREIDGTEFYFDSDHVLQNEWTTIAGKKYFLQNGVALRGPVYIDDKYYNFGEDGYLKSGWVSWRGQKFYNNKNGTVVTGWKKIGGKRYYFNDYGMMLINTTVDGYNIDNDGVAHKAK